MIRNSVAIVAMLALGGCDYLPNAERDAKARHLAEILTYDAEHPASFEKVIGSSSHFTIMEPRNFATGMKSGDVLANATSLEIEADPQAQNKFAAKRILAKRIVTQSVTIEEAEVSGIRSGRSPTQLPLAASVLVRGIRHTMPDGRVSRVDLMRYEARDWSGVIPRHTSFEMRNVAITSDLAPVPNPVTVLGEMDYDPDNRRMTIENLSMEIKDMGFVRLHVALSNISPMLSEALEARSRGDDRRQFDNLMLANLGATTRIDEIRLEIDDHGMSEALLAGSSRATVRSSMERLSNQLALMHNAVGDEIARFVRSPGRLVITVRPPGGISANEAMAQIRTGRDPIAVLGISAHASDG